MQDALFDYKMHFKVDFHTYLYILSREYGNGTQLVFYKGLNVGALKLGLIIFSG